VFTNYDRGDFNSSFDREFNKGWNRSRSVFNLAWFVFLLFFVFILFVVGFFTFKGVSWLTSGNVAKDVGSFVGEASKSFDEARNTNEKEF
jgi:hypothetical protein